ncbi:hypothetical protein BU23DRAFT_603479 [Bimuria novae-zelandiae CBS 107.79]|uniref:Uncharacterized protein n=1 Tax=Bimuria novae-zelandiae CBS 107.79 TaxID=1447943 RepID=A0A6A5UMW2_9PLEO|nr:hypothetical protein BU23DRAFT_603479 [Bimuria novae-zelandiae CBS 107.79]
MAIASARKSSWLAFLTGLATVTAQTPYWTYTTRFQDCYSTWEGVYSTYTSTTSCAIKSTVTPTETPYSTDGDFYTYGVDADQLMVTAEYYSSGAVPNSDLEPTYDIYATTTDSSTTSTSTYHVFSMLVTYTAPSSCSSSFTMTTNASVLVPTQVIDQVTPYAVVTSTPSPTRFATYIYETWYLSGGQAPFSSEDDYYYTEYIESCTTPYNYYPTETGSSTGGLSGGSDDGYSYCITYYGYGCTDVKVWVIIIAALIPGLFVLGIFESYFWFRRLMLGKGCLRFGTICWICISLWVACFTRSQSRRSPEDQKLLREKWKQTGFGTAIKLWFKWGFRHRYPVPLLGQYSRNTVGIVPEGQPLPAPGMVQTNGTYPGGPPPPPGAFIPNGPGQAYYPPPQGWAVAPNGQGYPMPPQGQPYMPGPNGVVQYYGDQTKAAPSATTASVSPVQHYGVPQPVPSPVSPSVPPQPTQPTNVAEAPAPTQEPVHTTSSQPHPSAQPPTNRDGAV